MAPLTHGQEITLAVTNTISSILSLIGSSLILRFLLFSKGRSQTSVYNRLLIAMSSFDLLHTFFVMLNPFLIPSNGGRVSAFGNDATCSMLGFFIQLGCTVPLYNVSLNSYYLLTIVYSVSEKKMIKYVEPAFHAISILFPLVTASLGAGIHLYSELELGSYCWIGEYPLGCDVDPNVPCNSTAIAWIYSGLPFIGSLLFLIVSNVMIYRKVSTTRTTSRQYGQVAGGMTTRMSVISVVSQLDSAMTLNTAATNTNNNNGTTTNSLWSRFGRRNNQNDSVRRRRPQCSKTKAVASQAFLYVAACFNTVFWMVLLRMQESSGVRREDESNIFWLSLMVSINFPLQVRTCVFSVFFFEVVCVLLSCK